MAQDDTAQLPHVSALELELGGGAAVEGAPPVLAGRFQGHVARASVVRSQQVDGHPG